MKSNENVRWFLIIVLMIVANLILSSFFFRLDMTKEKRYSLSEVGGIDLYGREENSMAVQELGSWVAVSAPCPGPGCPETACFVGKL